MKPLDFSLPRLMQVSWASPILRQRWQEVFAAAPSVLANRWVGAVGRGELSAVVFPAKPFDMPALMHQALISRLEVRVLEESQGLLAKMGWRDPKLTLTVAVGSPAAVQTIADRLDAGLEDEFLIAAGWPECCARTRAASPLIDPTWSFVLSAGSAAQGPRAEQLDWHPLLRALGISLLPSVPCSCDCTSSALLAQSLRRSEPVDEILSWPAHWSALHGLAEILLPTSKIVHDIDPSARKHLFAVESAVLPDDTPFGVAGPYREPARRRLRTTKGFQRGIATPRENPLPEIMQVHRIAPPFPAVLPQEPAIVEGVSEQWPAIRKWTLDYLVGRFGTRSITLERAGATRTTSFGAFARALETSKANGWYLKDFGFERDAADLLGDFALPECLHSWHLDLPPEDRPELTSLYIGGAGSGADLHFDLLYTCGFNTLISGRKHWYLCPPTSMANWLGAGPDLFDINVRDGLRLKGVRIQEHVQRPGETLFVPSGWWHQTRIIETSIALTGNIVNSWNAEKVREASLQAEHAVLRKLGSMLTRSIEAAEAKKRL